MNKTVNPNGLAILNTLKANRGSVLAFAEIANLAGIEPKTGFLTSAKKLASAEKLAIVKRENAVKVAVKTEQTFPNGLVIVKTSEVEVGGYELVDAE